MTATTTLLQTGHDRGRLLVRAQDGRRLGWHDLVSGATHLTEQDAGPVVADAVARHVARTSPLRSRRVHGLVPLQRRTHLPEALPTPPAGADLRERAPGGLHAAELLELLERSGPPSTRPAPAVAARLLNRRRLPDHARKLLVDVLTARDVAAALEPAVTWTVLHDVPADDDQVVDHLLVGPGGVVVIGRVSARAPLAGEAHVAEVVGERVRSVGRVLQRVGGGRVAVSGVVVAPRRTPEQDRRAGVTHLRVKDLSDWLVDLPRVVSSVDATRLVEQLADRSVWPGSDAADGTATPQQRTAEQEALARLLVELRLDRRPGARVAARIRG